MTTFLVVAISIGTVLLFGCIGEILTEKAGHLNLGIPGIMCMGTVGGCLAVSMYMKSLPDPAAASWWALVLSSVGMAFLFAVATGAIYAFLTVTLRCNQNITGLAITTFGNGFTQFLMNTVVDRSTLPAAGKIISTPFSFAGKLGGFGNVVFGHGFYVYFAIAIAVVTAVILNKTRVGLSLRAVGESPATADAAGVNVTRYKYGAILIGSGIAGFGGFYYIIDFLKGSWENASAVEAFGWLAIALVIFALWKPMLAAVGSILFGALFVVASMLEFPAAMKTLKLVLGMLPYVITIVVLIITSIVDKKENQPPASLGLAYFREER